MSDRGRIRSAIAAGLAAAAIAGCGLGAGPGTSDVSLNVTRNFGSQSIGQVTEKKVQGAETVMRLLQRHFQVGTQYGGGFVQSIGNWSGSSSHRDWFFYVNGIQAPKGAAATQVHKGDQIWWDLHDWQATDTIPAVVGSFPEPFTSGIGGRRLPTVLDCATNVQAACNKVGSELGKEHVPYADQGLGGGSGSDSLAVVVGTWSQLKGIIAAELIGAGPSHSGVYAQVVGPQGQVMELDNPAGQVVRTLHGSAGLIAATEQPSLNQPTWLITGTDVAGVNTAAAALTPARLRDHFALAVSGGQDLPIPLTPSR
ncbi:MAG TPA: DUF4430 domain-containing protein [Solirubrobacteraceae bacterium]|nr:DUF4430 domain-containing protein [Solirubrobacteraceae bacterium]